MFWKWFGEKSDDGTDVDAKREESMELPPLEHLENWVLQLVIKLGLEPGDFTFLPAYGGVLLFIKDQGLSWIPYNEIKDALGEIQTGKLVENSATIGGVAAVAATGAHLLPALLVHRLLKGSYRIFAQPSPKKSMNFLLSLIDKVIIQEKKLKESLLNTFEEIPYKSDKDKQFSTYAINIKRKFLDDQADSSSTKLMKGIKTFFTGSSEPYFVFPPQSDVRKFATILESYDVKVKYIQIEEDEKGELEYEIDDFDVVSGNQ